MTRNEIHAEYIITVARIIVAWWGETSYFMFSRIICISNGARLRWQWRPSTATNDDLMTI